MENSNRKLGKTYIGVRVREESPYDHSEKYTLTMAISGNEEGLHWLGFEKKSGATTPDYYNFIRRIIEIIGPGTPQQRRLITMDILLAHKNPTVIRLIVASCHCVCL